MQRKVCKCGEIFDDGVFETEYEWHSELDTGNRAEKYYIEMCPACGSTDWELKDICKCGQPCEYPKEWCNECHDEVSRWIRMLADKMKLSISDAEDLISEHLVNE